MPLTSPMAQRRSPARRILVNPDAVRAWLDAHRVEADAVDPRAPAGRDQQPVTPHVRAVIEMQDVVVTVALSGGGMLAEHQLDPVPAQGLAERLAERGRLTGNHPAGALDDHRLAAQTAHHLGQFDARGPAAEHQQAARDGLHARRLAGAPDSVELAEPGNWRHRRRGAGRDDNVVRGVAGAVDFDHAGAGQPAGAPQQVDVAVGEPALLAGVGIV